MTSSCDVIIRAVQNANTLRDCGPQRVLTSPTCKEVEMAKDRVCAIDGCCKPVLARGWCNMHYRRWKANGNPVVLKTQRKGAAKEWLESVASKFSGNECLTFPFRRRLDGYADFQLNGKKVLAHRFVCAIAHGTPPTPEHEASHSCGLGHEGCVNPRHLRWDTRSGNMSDKVAHGTHRRGSRSYNSKLNEESVREIRRLSGSVPYREIGERFGISTNVARLVAIGERWGWLK